MTPSAKLTRLRAMIGKTESAWTDQGRLLIGAAGQFLAESLFEKLESAWIKTVRHQNVYSAVLRDQVRASRPDYIVKIDEAACFIDAKNLSRTTDTTTNIGFSLGCDERDRLIAAGKYSGMEVLLVVWDRTDKDFTYGFAEPCMFDSSKIVFGRSCYEALFAPTDFVRHNF
jgi:hypothetical protein